MKTVTPFFALVAALFIHGCASHHPEIRPIAQTPGAAASPYDEAYESGKAHLRADRVGLAIVMFERALAINPLAVGALNGNGVAYDELRRPEVAEQYYTRALAIEPDSFDTLNNMGVSFQLAGRISEARVLFERAIALSHGDPTVQFNLAKLNQDQRRPPSPSSVAHIGGQKRPRLERSGRSQFQLITFPTPLIKGKPSNDE